jgi:hypothetical protein
MNAWSPDRGETVESHIRSRPGVSRVQARAEETTRTTGSTVGFRGASGLERDEVSRRRTLMTCDSMGDRLYVRNRAVGVGLEQSI